MEAFEERKISKNLWRAINFLAGLAIDPLDALKIVIVLFAYKRFSDSQGNNKSSDSIIVISENKKWQALMDGKSEHPLQIADANLRYICSKNKKIGNLAKIFDIKKYDKLIGLEDQKELFKLFSDIDLSPSAFNDKELIINIEDFFKLLSLRLPINPFFEHRSKNLKPLWIDNLVVRLLNPKDYEYFYVPSFGFGTIFVAFIRHIISKKYQGTFKISSLKVGGCEGNQEIWAIAVLIVLLANINIDRLENENYFSPSMYKILSGEFQKKKPIEMPKIKAKKGVPTGAELRTYLKQADSKTRDYFIDGMRDFLMKADVIFLSPPFAIRLSNSISSHLIFEGHTLEIPTSNTELLYMLLTLKQLNKEGRMAVILPLASLAREKKIWQVLCENDYLEAIIQLPEKVGRYSIPSVLVVFNKNKPQIKKYKFAFITVRKPRDSSLILDEELDRIQQTFENFKIKSDSDYIVSLEDIQKNDYELLPSYYIEGLSIEKKKLLDSGIGKKLEDVCEIKRGKNLNPLTTEGKGKIPFISTKDLAKDVTEPYLDLSQTSITFSNHSGGGFKQKCILVSLVGRDLKPTIYDPGTDATGVLIGHNVAIIVPNEPVVDFEYLYYQIYTPLVKKQFEALLTGAGVPSLSLQHLKSVIIPVPPIDVQRSLINQQRMLLLQAENERHKAFLERLKGVDKKQEAEFSIVRHLAHSIRPKLHIAKSPVSSIIDFLKDRELLGETLSVRLDGRKETVGEALEQAVKTLDQISDILASTRKLVTSEIGRSEFQEGDICKILERDIKPIYANQKFRIMVHCKGDCSLKLHRESFIEAINNLIMNAKVHAFAEGVKDAELRFNVHEAVNEVIIDYTNNGLKFPEDMTEEQFLTFGERRIGSPGEGLGGAWIGRFVEAHMGFFKIVRDKHPVHFRITLPKEL